MTTTTTPAPARPASAATKALVKCVLSGDTFVIWSRPTNAAPQEKVLSLAMVSAPHFGRRGVSEDEPFAFASREFLRKMLVGKEVVFRVEYSSQSGRDFVTVHVVGESESVNRQLVQAGWAKCRPDAKGSEAHEALIELEMRAQDCGLGLWTVSPADIAEAQPRIKFTLDDEPRKFLDAHKGTAVRGIVEQVRDGTTLRILLLPMFQNVTVMMSGVKAPAVRKDIPNTADLVEPYGEEAKYFTESRLLQREVAVHLEAVSNQNFLATVLHPAGNIAEALVASGLAKVVDWSITSVTGGPMRLRNAEKAAKDKKLRLWKLYTAKEKSVDGVSELKFDGIVTRIISADTIVVQSSNSGVEHKITFSSYRQPKAKEPAEAFYNFEAKEYVRSKLIGQKVSVSVEYTRPPVEGFEDQQPRVCGTVTLGAINIAEALLNKGLGGVIRHRKDDEDRSHHFDSLLAAEEKAQNAKKGMYSGSVAPVLRIADVSETAAKARSFLPSFTRAGRISGVVEFVSSGSRFKVYLPKENVKLTLVLAGIRCPRSPRAGPGPADKGGEPFGQEAADFASQKCLQRDVSIEVENIDKTGGFIGSLFIDRENLAVSLLEQGLATVHSFSADQSSHTNALYAAENIAKSQGKNLWTLKRAEEPTVADVSAVGSESVEVIVTEVLDGHHVYLQSVTPRLSTLSAMMSELTVGAKNAASSSSLKAGELVCAKYSLDGAWYRGKVRKVLPGRQAEVFYLDYGNTEVVDFADIRPLDAKHTKVPAMAQEAYISFIRVPDLDTADEYGVEAAECLKQLVDVRGLKANIDYRQGSVLYVTLRAPDATMSVTESLLQNGWAQVHKPRGALQYDWARLEELEMQARRRRVGMFEYGDYSLDKEE